MALTRSLRFGHHVVWRVPDDSTHISGASAGTSARPGKAATVRVLNEASLVWHSEGARMSYMAGGSPRARPKEDLRGWP